MPLAVMTDLLAAAMHADENILRIMVVEYGKSIEGLIQKDLNWCHIPRFIHDP